MSTIEENNWVFNIGNATMAFGFIWLRLRRNVNATVCPVFVRIYIAIALLSHGYELGGCVLLIVIMPQMHKDVAPCPTWTDHATGASFHKNVSDNLYSCAFIDF